MNLISQNQIVLLSGSSNQHLHRFHQKDQQQKLSIVVNFWFGCHARIGFDPHDNGIFVFLF
jgi:hypothetical protein